MKSILEYYYNLNNVNFLETSDRYFVECEEGSFIFEEYIYDFDELKKIVVLLNNSKVLYHLIVYTKEGEIFSLYDDKKYVLLKIRTTKEDKISLFDFKNIIVSGSLKWDELWSNRIDYYETQVNEVIKEKNFKYSLQYYIGLTENAIAYVNVLNEKYKNNNLVYNVSHRYIDLPLDNITFYNPLNLIIDLDIRDFAEYVKNAFFNEILTNSEIIEIINSYNFSNESANYFFARLLYPSYFFKYYDEYVETSELNDNIFLIIKKSSDFELLVKSIYNRLVIRYDIILDAWIIKSQH